MAISLGKLFVEIGAKTASFRKGIKDVNSRLDKMSERAGKVAKTSGIAFAGMGTAIGFALKAANEQEKAERKLAAAIKSTGSSIDFDAIRKYASELQSVSTFGDEATISAAAMLTSFGLNEQQLRTLLPVMQDVAAATGQDMAAAGNQMAKAIANGAGEMTESFTTAQKEAFRLADTQGRVALMAKIMGSRFGGAAQEMAKTVGGAFTQMTNATGDLTEEIGFLFQGPAIAGMGMVKNLAVGMADAFKALSHEARNIAAGFAILIPALTGIVAMSATLIKLWPLIGVGMKVLIAPIAAVTAGIVGLIALGGALRLAWRDNLGGIREKWADFVEGFRRGVGLMMAPLNMIVKGLIGIKKLVSGEGLAAAAAAMSKFDKAGGLGSVGPAAAGDLADVAKDIGSNIWGSLKKSLDSGFKLLGFDFGDHVLDKLKREADAVGGAIGSGATKATKFDVDKFIHARRHAFGSVGGESFVRQRQRKKEQARFDAVQGELSRAGGTVVGAMGNAGSLINAGMQGASAGLMGMAAGIGAQLLTQSKGFQEIMTAVNGMLQVVVDSGLTPFLDILKPFVALIGKFTMMLAPLIQFATLLPAFQRTFEIAFDVLRNIIVVIGRVVWVVIDAIATVLRTIEKAVNQIPKVNVNLGGKAMKKAARTLDKQIKSLEGMSFQEAGEFIDSFSDKVEEGADKMGKLNSELLNAPAGFRTALRRFQASEGAVVPVEQGAAGGSTTFNIDSPSPQHTAELVRRELERKAFMGGGSFLLRGPYAVPSGGG